VRVCGAVGAIMRGFVVDEPGYLGVGASRLGGLGERGSMERLNVHWGVVERHLAFYNEFKLLEVGR